MGALNTPEVLARLESTPALRDLDVDDFDRAGRGANHSGRKVAELVIEALGD